MTFDKFFKLCVDLIAERSISEEDNREFVDMMSKLRERQPDIIIELKPPNMTLIDYAKKIASGKE